MTTWKDLFDRAAAHDVSPSTIRGELERRRSDDGDEDGRGERDA